MQRGVLNVWDQNRDQADTTSNHYGVIDISGDGSTILGNVYQNYYAQPKEHQASEHVASTIDGHNVHWSINRSKNPNFTGRQNLINKISKTVCDTLVDLSPNDQCHNVITGMGGQGKSEICLQVAHRVRSLFWAVWWVDASTLTSIQSDFQVIGNQLHISDSTVDDVRRALANLKHPWLLVLDNADDSEIDYVQYFPTGYTGVIILTSRNSECAQYGTSDTIALDGLPSSDARELLLKAARVPQHCRNMYEPDAELVTSFLLGHPLAIIQAGAYIQRGHCSLARYLRVFQQNRKRLLKFRPAQARSRYGDVYATFEASADAIRSMKTEVADDALQLLSMLAMLSSRQLPLSLFEQVWRGAKNIPSLLGKLLWVQWRTADLQAISFLPKFIQPTEDTWDSYRLLEAVHLLEMYSLVATNDIDGTKCVSMHPLAHAWAKDRQEILVQQQSWLKAACSISVSSLNPEDLHHLDVWTLHQRQLRPHLLALAATEDDHTQVRVPQTMIVRVLYRCGILLATSGLEDELFKLMQNTFSWLNIGMNTVDPKWLPLYELYASEVLMNRRPLEAISLLEQVVELSKQELTGTEEIRIYWVWRLAEGYLKHNQAQKTIKLLEAVLSHEEHEHIEKHADYLKLLNGLAEAYWRHGQTRKAESLLQKIAIKTNGQTLFPTHGDYVRCLSWLAETYGRCGQHQKAITTLEQIVAIRENTLAKSHPDRLHSQNYLAFMYLQGGQLRKATLMLGKIVAIQERNLVESHPGWLSAQHNLAIAYGKIGEVRKAIVMLEKVVNIKENSHVDSSQRLLISQYELARAYIKGKKASRAIPLLGKIVEAEPNMLAEDNGIQMAALCQLAKAYSKSGLKQNAIPILEEVVRIYGRTQPENNRLRLKSQTELAIMYHDIGRLEEAIQMMQNVARIRRQALDDQAPDRKYPEDRSAYLENLIMQRALARVRGDFPLGMLRIGHRDIQSIHNARSCPDTPILINPNQSSRHVWLDDMIYIKPCSIEHRGFYIDDENDYNDKPQDDEDNYGDDEDDHVDDKHKEGDEDDDNDDQEIKEITGHTRVLTVQVKITKLHLAGTESKLTSLSPPTALRAKSEFS